MNVSTPVHRGVRPHRTPLPRRAGRNAAPPHSCITPSATSAAASGRPDATLRVMAPTTQSLHDFVGRAALGLPLFGGA